MRATTATRRPTSLVAAWRINAAITAAITTIATPRILKPNSVTRSCYPCAGAENDGYTEPRALPPTPGDAIVPVPACRVTRRAALFRAGGDLAHSTGWASL